MGNRIEVSGPRHNEARFRGELASLQGANITSISERVDRSNPITKSRRLGQFDWVQIVIEFVIATTAPGAYELMRRQVLSIAKKHGFSEREAKANREVVSEPEEGQPAHKPDATPSASENEGR